MKAVPWMDSKQSNSEGAELHKRRTLKRVIAETTKLGKRKVKVEGPDFHNKTMKEL